jgi:6-phosphogluconate dehydrogenase/gluconokinase
MSQPMHIVVMGVSGSGKSTVGIPLADKLGFDFAEGDQFHPQANVDKMSAGRPLDDDDRWPWLQALAEWTRQRDADGVSTVITCSALKRRYRDVLREGGEETRFVHLVGDAAMMRDRMHAREHFMPPTLLTSQLDTLEPLGEDERGIVADIAIPVEEIVADLVQWVREQEGGG